jgi:hypothetical protein
MSKNKSTTFIITIATLLLNPIAWIIDWLLKKNIIKYLIDNNIDISKMDSIDKFLIDIPLTTLATAFVTIATAYVAGNKGKAVSKNLGQPMGVGIDEDQSDDSQGGYNGI